MKKYISLALALALLLCLAACGSTAPAPEATPSPAPTETAAPAAETMGGKYLAAFTNSSAATAEAAANELIALGIIGTELVPFAVSEGYLDGFNADITGFTAGVKFSPMIGAIPFVGYVFESDAPEALLELLSAHADEAWNICTVADETVSGIRGNLVFFLMCSNEE